MRQKLILRTFCSNDPEFGFTTVVVSQIFIHSDTQTNGQID